MTHRYYNRNSDHLESHLRNLPNRDRIERLEFRQVMHSSFGDGQRLEEAAHRDLQKIPQYVSSS